MLIDVKYRSESIHILAKCIVVATIKQGESLGKTAQELRNKLQVLLSSEEDKGEDKSKRPSYTAYFEEVISRKHKSTATSYRHTLGRIRSFASDADSLRFEDLNKAWLERFGLGCKHAGEVERL